jgi:hypothetical protein
LGIAPSLKFFIQWQNVHLGVAKPSARTSRRPGDHGPRLFLRDTQYVHIVKCIRGSRARGVTVRTVRDAALWKADRTVRLGGRDDVTVRRHLFGTVRSTTSDASEAVKRSTWIGHPFFSSRLDAPMHAYINSWGRKKKDTRADDFFLLLFACHVSLPLAHISLLLAH